MRAGLLGVGQVALAGAVAAGLTWQIARGWPAPPVERATIASVAFVPLWTVLALALLAWRRRARPGAARRQLFALHRGLGGALAALAIVVFGSGIGAVLDRSLTRWQLEHGQAQEVPALREQPLDAVLGELLALHPELRDGELALHPASPAQPWVQADFFTPDRQPRRIDFDPHTGARRASGAGPLWVLRELHRRLLVQPLIGESLLGLVGLALGLVLLAGLATRRLRGLLRRRPRAQPRSMSLHQWIGLGTLPAALLWAWSGALLGLTLVIVPIVGGAAYDGDRPALMRDVLAVDRPPKLPDPAPLPDVQATIAASCPLVRAQLPEAEVHRVIIRHPGLRSGRVRVDVEGGGLLQRGSFHRGVDGTLRDCRALPAAGVGLQSFMAVIALHYGEWEEAWAPAWLVDGAYILLGAGLVGLAWLGGVLLARRRERDGDPAGAERTRRWLLGVGLGLALASAALLLLSRVPALARDESVALTGALAVFAIAVTIAHTRLRHGLLLALALALAAVPVVGWFVADVPPGAVEASFVGLAIALVVVHMRLHRRVRDDG